jgi:multidrug efflux pump subunit AcrA (membrane-fusion protein)
MTTRIIVPALVIAAGLALSGCQPPESAASPTVAPPTIAKTTAPPKTPTDQSDTDWLTGTVTAGGSGPCYGLVTDDGTKVALHAADGRVLTKGARIRVRTKPALTRIYCGPGLLLEMTAAEPAG